VAGGELKVVVGSAGGKEGEEGGGHKEDKEHVLLQGKEGAEGGVQLQDVFDS
jgi:hypothetical protein